MTIEQGVKRITDWPKVAGIFNIIAGVIFSLVGLYFSFDASQLVSKYGWESAYRITSVGNIGVMLGTVALIGGIQAIKKKRWSLALAGTIATSLLGIEGFPIARFLGIVLVLVFLGIPSIYFLLKGKAQFEKEEQWRGSVGGLLSLAVGITGILEGYVIATTGHFVAMYIGWPFAAFDWLSILVILIGVISLSGGICALIRKQWQVALTGALSSFILFMPVGIFAAVFVASGRREFKTKRSFVGETLNVQSEVSIKPGNKVMHIVCLIIATMLFAFSIFLFTTQGVHFHNSVQVVSFFIIPVTSYAATILALFYPRFGGWLFIASALILGILMYIGYPRKFLEEIGGYLIYSVPMIITGVLWLRSGASMIHMDL